MHALSHCLYRWNYLHWPVPSCFPSWYYFDCLFQCKIGWSGRPGITLSVTCKIYSQLFLFILACLLMVLHAKVSSLSMAERRTELLKILQITFISNSCSCYKTWPAGNCLPLRICRVQTPHLYHFFQLHWMTAYYKIHRLQG